MRRVFVLGLVAGILTTSGVAGAVPTPDPSCAQGTPVVAVTQRNVNVPDYGWNNIWASDEWVLEYLVFQTAEDDFCILRAYAGKFASYVGIESPNTTGTIDSRINGAFAGFYVSRAKGALNPDPGAALIGVLPDADWGCPPANGPAPASCDTAQPTPPFPQYFAGGTVKTLQQGYFRYEAERGCGSLEETFEKETGWAFQGDITSAQCLL